MDVYCPFILKNNTAVWDFINSVNKQIEIDLENHLSIFNSLVITSLNDIDVDLGHSIKINSNYTTSIKNKPLCNPTFEEWNNHSSTLNTNAEMYETATGINIEVLPGEVEELYRRREQLDSDYDDSLKVYGEYYTSLQKRIVLFPFQVTLSNNKIVWLNAVVFIFSNGMGVLKIELPIIDLDTTPLQSTEIDNYINGISNIWGLPNFYNDNTIKCITNAYFNYLLQSGKDTIFSYSAKILNTILVDFDCMPDDVNDIPEENIEKLYRILCAPIPEVDYTSYRKDAVNYFNEHNWGNHNIKYIANVNGNCLSIVDRILKDHVMTAEREEAIDEVSVNFALINKVSINIEFALVLIILKRITNEKAYMAKAISPKEIFKIQSDYYNDIIFMANLQNSCFCSVREQLDALEKKMIYYLNETLLSQKITAIDKIIDDEKTRKTEKFSNLLSISGFLISLIFGLPGIFETLTILRNLCSFMPYDIKYVSVLNLSFIIWIVVIVVLLFKFSLIKRKSKK